MFDNVYLRLYLWPCSRGTFHTTNRYFYVKIVNVRHRQLDTPDVCVLTPNVNDSVN